MKCLLPTTGGPGHGRPQLCHDEAQGSTHHQSPTKGGAIPGSGQRDPGLKGGGQAKEQSSQASEGVFN